MDLAIQIFQFILSISILVVLHELGHYLPAKWFKTRAEKFFLFFDPWFSLFSMKKINGKWKYKFFSKNQPDTEIIEIDGEKKKFLSIQKTYLMMTGESTKTAQNGVSAGCLWEAM